MRLMTSAKFLMLFAIGSVSFCSCQGIGKSLPKFGGKTPAAVDVAAEQEAAPLTAPKANSYPGAQVGYWDEAKIAQQAAYAQHRHQHDANCTHCQQQAPRAAARQSGGCPCAGCQGNQPFRFSDSCDAEPHGALEMAGDGQPWPEDEYLWNGCDVNDDARAREDFTVVGLDPQDTIAHYDTLDGHTETTPANCVPIYSPRFASVRKVTNPLLYEGQEQALGVDKPTKLGLHNETRVATTAVQPLQPLTDVGLDPAISFRERLKGIGMERVQPLAQATQGFLPYEDLRTIKFGVYEVGEKARLAKSALAANTWQTNQAVQVIIDGQMLVEAIGTKEAEELRVYDLLGKPRLRIVKVANKSEAQVGETVDFTLRFDNVGDQTIGNVTIIDHLVTRLEYVPDSQQCSRDADFKTEASDGESLILRWEIKEPMKVGEGGIIRFQCQLR